MRQRVGIIMIVITIASAAAALGYEIDERRTVSLSGAMGVKPWAIPDWDYVVGKLMVLDYGVFDPPTDSTSFFYAVDFPPINKGTPITGADEYFDNVIYGSSMLIEIGDHLQVEPGNLISPTHQGVTALIAMDPDAYWDTDTQTIQGSLFPEFTSPRVCKVSMYPETDPPASGRDEVLVVRLGAFFLEGMQGNDILVRMLSWEESGVQESVEWPASGAVQLSAPYPQPSTGEVTLLLSVDRPTVVNFKVYDLTGRVVRALEPETFEEGHHSVFWDGTDDKGERVSSGIYFCRMEAGGITRTNKMILAR